MQNTFSNWSGSVVFHPKEILYPTTEQEIIDIVHRALNNKKKIRIVGSAHSFTRLVETDNTLLSLDNYNGIIHVDKDKKLITVKAGTKIKAFGEMAFGYGFAQENLGDIDAQSLAGSISTGTHGTGLNFGNISSQLYAIKFINGKGETVYCSEDENKELLKAAQVSLGSLGIITELTFKVQEAYKLSFVSKNENIQDVFAQLDKHNIENRNFEFYWFPYTDVAQTKYSNISQEEAVENKLGLWYDNLMENHLFNAISYPTRYIPSLSKYVAKISGALAGTSSKVNWSHRVYALPRTVLFNEMEYCVPIESFSAVKKELIRVFNQKKFHVHVPTENRFVKADDIMISASYKLTSAYISFHVYKGKAYQEYFKTMEEICSHYEGRPHWGKMHNKEAKDFANMYERWNDFLEIRKVHDPENIFVSEYTKKLFGI